MIFSVVVKVGLDNLPSIGGGAADYEGDGTEPVIVSTVAKGDTVAEMIASAAIDTIRLNRSSESRSARSASARARSWPANCSALRMRTSASTLAESTCGSTGCVR